MEYQAFINENEIRLITILPARGPDEMIQCTRDNHVLDDLYLTQEYQRCRLHNHPNGNEATLRSR